MSNYTKLKTNLKIAIQRLKLVEKKKTELSLKSRKEIADYLAINKPDRAKIRVEHIIREDNEVEAMETVEMFCDLLLARFGLIEKMKELDPGLDEAISTVIWAAPRLSNDIQELKIVSEIFEHKYGKKYAESCRVDALGNVNDKVKRRMGTEAPPKLLVEQYLIEIAKNFNVEYVPDPQTFHMPPVGFSEELINFYDRGDGGGGNSINDGGNAGGYGGGSSSSGGGGGGGGGGFSSGAEMNLPKPPVTPTPAYFGHNSSNQLFLPEQQSAGLSPNAPPAAASGAGAGAAAQAHQPGYLDSLPPYDHQSKAEQVKQQEEEEKNAAAAGYSDASASAQQQQQQQQGVGYQGWSGPPKYDQKNANSNSADPFSFPVKAKPSSFDDELNLPSVPTDTFPSSSSSSQQASNNNNNAKDMNDSFDFDELSKRFNNLKK